ncbi:MAG: B12-binding domain-containing radical SAM protein [Candidatus Omnitrophica bacterium]|jgi:radical SAM superfamily enzyme YgiQ (UPF0313 family)|nr:B12-binding domain-containing radical SAM protein [Candidatus Omnitrophota bacterium]
MKKCILFNPPSSVSVYSKSKIRAAVPRLPVMSLAMIAASLIEEGIDVSIIDLSAFCANDIWQQVRSRILDFEPDMVGVTSTTPLFYEASRISQIAKSVSRNILTIIGGPHASSLPQEVLRESSFDIAVVGEGEQIIKKIARGQKVSKIIEKGGELPIEDLPFPALHLFDINNYSCPGMIARNNPVGPIEMSRGCVFNCTFCNKTVHGRKFRIKSAKRVVEELFILKKLGYREFHVLDDQFTTDISKAKEICEAIIRSNINMTWNLRTGVRVDRIDDEFLKLARKAGCYQVGVGFESGCQEMLDKINKGITIEQAFRASRMIKKAGLELVGFFMLGFPGETERSINKTIDFAIRLNPDFAKATIMVPFPGTSIYDEYKQQGLIKTQDWACYNFHNPSQIYQHDTLSWDKLNFYYNDFHRRFYLRPSFLIKKLFKSSIQGRLFVDFAYGYQTFRK